MSAEVILFLVKYVLIPAGLIGALFGTGWHYGAANAKKDWQQQVSDATERAQRQAIEASARERYLTAKVEKATRLIEEQSNVHNTEITRLAESNRDLLQRRVQHDTAATCPDPRLSTTPRTTRSRSIPKTPGHVILNADEGLAVVRAAEEADRLIESLKACRNYLDTLKGLACLKISEAK